uniref:Uncharacterized protein n=1 Tax=Arundo donax TaxID=35708 RepID=A0A0A9BG61_ARUDO
MFSHWDDDKRSSSCIIFVSNFNKVCWDSVCLPNKLAFLSWIFEQTQPSLDNCMVTFKGEFNLVVQRSTKKNYFPRTVTWLE